MSSSRRWLAFGTVVLLSLPGSVSADEKPQDQPAQAVSFAKEVAPILVRQCLACHGEQSPKGGLSLATFETLMRGGSAGDTIVAGKPDDSTLVIQIEDGLMPQDADPLPQEQISLIRRWVAEGAKYDGPSPGDALATIVPKGVHPPAPQVYQVPVPISAVAFKPGGHQLAVAGYHEVLIWCRECGTLTRRLGNVAERTYALAYNPEGTLLAVGGGNPATLGEVKLFDPKTGEQVKDLLTTSDSVFCVAFSPDGTRLAAGGADRAIRIWDVASGEQQLLIEDHADWVMDLAWSPDGKKLASASRDKTSKVFDTTSGDSLITFPNHGEPVFAVTFSPDGALVASGGRDKRIRLWNPADANQVREIGGHDSEIYNVAYTSGEQVTLLSTSADRTVRQFKPEDGSQIRVLEGHGDYVYAASYSPETQELATGDWRGEIRIWNLKTGTQTERFLAAPGYKEPPAVAQASR